VGTALVATTTDGLDRSRLSTLRSDAPLILRPTIGKGREP
jgi:hypothetical protein